MQNFSRRKLLLMVVGALAAGAAFLYWRVQGNEMSPFPLQTIHEQERYPTKHMIQIGNVGVDIVDVEGLQRQVDQGHQPWRLNPCIVAKVEVRDYGFTAQDAESLVCPAPNYETQRDKQGTVIQAEIRHDGQRYNLTIGQPVPGANKIWRILGISKK